MAGSYNHAVTPSGNLRRPDSFSGMIENLGDAYEMAEEMYGMIWFLAGKGRSSIVAKAMVETARKNYKEGLKIAKEHNQKRKDQ